MGSAPRRAFAGAAAAAAAVLAASACGNNNNNVSEPRQPPAEERTAEERDEEVEPEASEEAEFALALLNAAYDGEEQLADLATDRAQSARVEAHADDLMEDYERLGGQVDQVSDDLDIELDGARGIGPQVSRELENVYEQQRETLETMEGAEFDRAYLSSLLVTTQATMNELERVLRDIREGEVRELVQEHLDAMSRQLERTRDVARREGIRLQG